MSHYSSMAKIEQVAAMVQWLELWCGNPKNEGSNPEFFTEFFFLFDLQNLQVTPESLHVTPFINNAMTLH